MHYNICVVRPPGYAHSGAFTELAEVVAYGLDDLGHTVHISENAMMPDARNLLIGCHLADPDATAHVPDDTIVINTEQIHVDEQPWNEKIYRWASRYETWDYSERNLAKLRRLGIAHAHYLKLGFHPALRRIPHDVEQDIDVLFYGTIGPRRAAILDALQARGLNVGIVSGGIYGAPRDAAIARAKVVLNLHHYASQIFEVVRVFYLMTNGKAVVGEVSPATALDPDYAGGFQAAPYDGLVDACVELVRHPERRRALEAAALETIGRHPQARALAPLLREALAAS
ncbi:CgeB family protein [Burkholderia seminalis]|uniref:uL13 family ribosomal protein n=1 Tax=Burkholderia seminalis TaxID=488731 RepID=UPI001908B756|nr:uL13 family ribosomal protein [Burkholderia seminalis]MBJ9590919.1 uL13 family ribosomal protein [Burkholderia seminalis]